MNKYQQLQHLYYSLAQHSHTVNFHNAALRDLDHHGRLERPFFALAAILAADANLTNQSYTIMVTASHNPPGYNGLKVDALFADLKLNEHEVAQILNNSAKTMELIQKSVKVQPNKGIFYIGRDKRPSSPYLSSVIRLTLQLLGRKVIDLGERSTPETLSLSQFLHEKHLKGQTFTGQLVKNYFQGIRVSFSKAVDLISFNLGKKWRKKQLCLDFSKGVGGQSLKNYLFLHDYFELHSINFQDFSNPNQNCGAEWFYRHFQQHECLPLLNNYPQVQQYYFFDGDSDRIIAKMCHQNSPIDGDDLNACFISLLRQLLDSIQIGRPQLCSVGNISSNQALQRYMGSLLINYRKVPVGVKHLWAQVKTHDIGCYFQNSGHGCLYFSEKILHKLKQLSSKHWQAELLLLLHQLSRNNSRGYALHDMLIFQIYLYYFGVKTAFLFEKSYLLNREYQLSRPELFANGKTGSRLLQKPFKLAEVVAKLQLNFRDESIIIRKSSTSPIIRLTIQGRKERCEAILSQIQPEIMLILNEVQNQA